MAAPAEVSKKRSNFRIRQFKEQRHFNIAANLMFNTMVSFVILLIACTARIACADRQTYTHTRDNYCNPRCACATRVNNSSQTSKHVKNKNKSGSSLYSKRGKAKKLYRKKQGIPADTSHLNKHSENGFKFVKMILYITYRNKLKCVVCKQTTMPHANIHTESDNVSCKQTK